MFFDLGVTFLFKATAYVTGVHTLSPTCELKGPFKRLESAHQSTYEPKVKPKDELGL